MSKRRINIQQKTRISRRQHELVQFQIESADMNDGLVLCRFARHAEIEHINGERIHCAIRPTIETLVAGDKVVWQAAGDNQGVVLSCYPRHSVLARINQRGEQKPVAANITQLIIVLAALPEIHWPLLDSYLIMADLLSLHALIVMNKTDLPCEADKQRLHEDYQALGYDVLLISSQNGQGMDQLANHLNHHTSVFVGQSGVGKSSLIRCILPHEEIATAAISIQSELGKHTTSNSRYYHLPGGGALIDSPGVREFNLWDISFNSLAKAYREFKPLLGHCKFRDCNHLDTPNCAIVNAVRAGLISNRRYDNFIKLRQTLKQNF